MLIERITVEELQENLDDYMDRVEDGEHFIITVNGKCTAVLMPFQEYKELYEDE